MSSEAQQNEGKSGIQGIWSEQEILALKEENLRLKEMGPAFGFRQAVERLRDERYRVVGVEEPAISAVDQMRAKYWEVKGLADALCALLSNHCGETGQIEGAVDTLKRLLTEIKAARQGPQEPPPAPECKTQ